MKRTWLVFLVVLSIVGWVAFNGFRNFQEVSYSFGGFTSPNAGDVANVDAGLRDYLASHGFVMGGAPSAMASWAGIHSSGERQTWWVGNTDATRNVFIRVTSTPMQVETDLVWSVKGFPWQMRDANARALRAALDIDQWRESRPEKNVVPEEDRKRARETIERDLAGIYR